MPNACLCGLHSLNQVWQNVFGHPIRPMRFEAPGKSAALHFDVCTLQLHSGAKANGGDLP
jgi:hypothetical protein